MKKYLFIVLFLSAKSGGIFFGYNSWTHKVDENLNITNQAITRIIYDDGLYYVMPYDDGVYHLCVGSERINTLNHFDYKKTANSLTVHTVEDVNFESWYTFTKESEEFFVTLEGTLGGVIDSVHAEYLPYGIRLSYNVRRPVRGEVGYSTEKYTLSRCTDTFFNTDRAVLKKAVAYSFNRVLDNQGGVINLTAELAEKIFSKMNSAELKIVRNLIFARHNYQFKTRELHKLFSETLKNYNPSIIDSNEIMLTDYEKELIRIIQKYE